MSDEAQPRPATKDAEQTVAQAEPTVPAEETTLDAVELTHVSLRPDGMWTVGYRRPRSAPMIRQPKDTL